MSRAFTGIAVTHANILTPYRSIPTLRRNFSAIGILPYPEHIKIYVLSLIFGIELQPREFLAQNSLVSKLLRTF